MNVYPGAKSLKNDGILGQLYWQKKNQKKSFFLQKVFDKVVIMGYDGGTLNQRGLKMTDQEKAIREVEKQYATNQAREAADELAVRAQNLADTLESLANQINKEENLSSMARALDCMENEIRNYMFNSSGKTIVAYGELLKQSAR